MNGERFLISKVFRDLNRRSFLFRAGLIAGGVFLDGCVKKINRGKGKYKHIKGRLLGPNEKAGHLLRSKLVVPKTDDRRVVKTLIIGSGISGLSAGRWLKKQGYTDFEILELEDHVGGNSHSVKNEVSSYPLGAHYITIANNEDAELVDFLTEHKVITHFDNGLPYYNEFYLCFDPEERLLINGQWQEGLIPQFGIAEKDKKQITEFFELMEVQRRARGADGKYAFTIPVDEASSDEAFTRLDQISFGVFLKERGFDSEYLLWYLNYCCKDDYGQGIDKVSAWAGIGYFASHKGKAANTEEGAVLTWPEGNGWLVNRLREYLVDHIRPSKMVMSVETTEKGLVEVEVLDLPSGKNYRVEATNVIMACPQFVNKKIIKNDRFVNLDKLQYSPWMVANITLKDFPNNGAQALSWDNVPYGKPSVGYVFAGHQSVSLNQNKKVVTFYLPLCDRDPRTSRLAAYSRTFEQWLDLIIPEMEFMHPGVTESIENVDVWVWGHGMVVPSIGYIWGEERRQLGRPIANRIFFAHTDLSGVSLFEEGFHQGIRAAKGVLDSLK